MKIAGIPVPADDVSTPMGYMRLWLDRMRFEPSNFTWRDVDGGSVVRARFKVDTEAVVFAEQFEGRVL